jgi:hypothetical protein
MFVVKLVGLKSGLPTPYDGCYLSSYRVGVGGVDSTGARVSAEIEARADIKEALMFQTMNELAEYCGKIDPCVPKRKDGSANRPLMVFVIAVLEIDDNDNDELRYRPIGFGPSSN